MLACFGIISLDDACLSGHNDKTLAHTDMHTASSCLHKRRIGMNSGTLNTSSEVECNLQPVNTDMHNAISCLHHKRRVGKSCSFEVDYNLQSDHELARPVLKAVCDLACSSWYVKRDSARVRNSSIAVRSDFVHTQSRSAPARLLSC